MSFFQVLIKFTYSNFLFMIVPIVITITVIVLLSLSLIDLIGGKLTRLPVLMDLSNSLTLGNAPPVKDTTE